MSNNWDLIEHNEASKNANGGTEIFMRFLYDGTIPRDLIKEAQIIPARVRDLQEDKLRILTLHNLAEDPESAPLKDESFRNKFHKIVFISNWQMQQYMNVLNIPYTDKLTVIESGSENIDVDINNKPDDVINIVYSSTPQRGLNILIEVFNKLCETHKNIRLHVHSSFKIYGWDEYDKQFEVLYEKCRNNPQIIYHGYTPHAELKAALKNYHILAYPCIWQETQCRVLIESMSAGLMCVHPNFGALWDTSGGLNFTYQGDQDINKHANIFYDELNKAILTLSSKKPDMNQYLSFVKSYADFRWSTQKAHFQWQKLLIELQHQYPTLDSRKVSERILTFRTH